MTWLLVEHAQKLHRKLCSLCLSANISQAYRVNVTAFLPIAFIYRTFMSKLITMKTSVSIVHIVCSCTLASFFHQAFVGFQSKDFSLSYFSAHSCCVLYSCTPLEHAFLFFDTLFRANIRGKGFLWIYLEPR